MVGGRHHVFAPTPKLTHSATCPHPERQLAAYNRDEVRQAAVIGQPPLFNGD